jgi:hypothetical protein
MLWDVSRIRVMLLLLLLLTTRLVGRASSVWVTQRSTAAAMAAWISGLTPDMDSTALKTT